MIRAAEYAEQQGITGNSLCMIRKKYPELIIKKGRFLYVTSKFQEMRRNYLNMVSFYDDLIAHYNKDFRIVKELAKRTERELSQVNAFWQNICLTERKQFDISKYDYIEKMDEMVEDIKKGDLDARI